MKYAWLCLVMVGCMKETARVSVKTKPDGALLQKGQQMQLRAVAYDRDGLILDAEDMAWTSSQPQVADIDGKGMLTAKTSGTTQITATSGGKSESVEARVQIVGSVDVTGAVPKLKLGKAITLTAVVKDDHGTAIPDAKVRWSTSTHAFDLESTGPKTLATSQALGECEIYAESQGKIGSTRLSATDK